MRRKFEGQAIGFLALSLDPDPKAVREAAQALGIQMSIATAEGEVLGPLGVNQVPSTVFLNAEGTIVAAASGARKRSFFERRVQALLSPPAP